MDRLVESLDLTDVKVDRENFVIRGVKLSGRRSRNKRNGRAVVYSDAVITKTAKVFEGCPVTVRGGHNIQSRDYNSQNGQLRSGRTEDLGTERACSRFDWHLNRKDPLTEKILEDAEHFPQNIPLSQELRNPTVTLDKDGKSYLVEDFPADPVAIGVAAVYRGGLNDSLFEHYEDDEMEIKTVEELKAQFPSLCEQLTECACAAQRELVEGKDSKLADAIAAQETLKAELADVRAKLQQYLDAEEKSARIESIKADAKEIINESYEVPEDLLESLLDLYENEGHKKVLTAIAKHTKQEGEDPPPNGKPQSASGANRRKNTGTERSIGYRNL